MELHNSRVLTCWLALVIVIQGIAFHGVLALETRQKGKAHKSTVTANKPSIARNQRDIGKSSAQNGKSVSSSSSEGAMKFLPWLDLEMTLPPKDDGSDSDAHEVSEMSVELRFDDDTEPTKIIIVDPNITWSGDGKHQMTIRPTDHTPVSSSPPTSPPHQPHTTKMEMSMDPTPTAVCNCPDIDDIIDAVLHANILKGATGEKGDRGMNGIPGLSIQGEPGQKGESGDPATLPYHSSTGPISAKGERGPIGPPGVCTPKDCAGGDATNPSHWRQSSSSFFQKPSIPPEQLYKIVPGALVFPTRRSMLQMQTYSFIGTVAFVEEDESFYGRVKSGWKSFNMGSRVHRVILSTPNSTDRPKPLLTPQQSQLHASQRRPEEIVYKPELSPNCNSADYRANRCIESKTPLHTDTEKDDSVQFRTKTLVRGTISQTVNAAAFDSRESKLHNRSHTMIDKTPLSRMRIIALNSATGGNQGGHNQVNYQCQRQATKTNLHGVFRALHIVPETMAQAAKQLYVNLKNESLGSGAKMYSFNGKEVDSTRVVWRGPKAVGKMNCRSWTSDSSQVNGPISSIEESLSGDRFTLDDSNSSSCDQKHVVLCIEFLHLDQVNMRHRNRVRLSFDKYLSILKKYDE